MLCADALINGSYSHSTTKLRHGLLILLRVKSSRALVCVCVCWIIILDVICKDNYKDIKSNDKVNRSNWNC